MINLFTACKYEYNPIEQEIIITITELKKWKIIIKVGGNDQILY